MDLCRRQDTYDFLHAFRRRSSADDRTSRAQRASTSDGRHLPTEKHVAGPLRLPSWIADLDGRYTPYVRALGALGSLSLSQAQNTNTFRSGISTYVGLVLVYATLLSRHDG